MSYRDERPPGMGPQFGNPEKVFDETGANASGRTHDTPTFYALSVFFAVVGYAALATTAYLCRGWVSPNIWWYMAALLGVLVSMLAGSLWAIASQSWIISLFAYLVLVASPFGALFGPLVAEVGRDVLFPVIIITAALMVLACLIGLLLPRDLYKTWFGDMLAVALIVYLVLSVSLLKLSATYPTIGTWIAVIGIVLFFLITVNDSNRLKSIASKDTDNAVDGGMQLWLNSVNMLLRVLVAKKN